MTIKKLILFFKAHLPASKRILFFKATFKEQPGYDLREGPRGKNRWMRGAEALPSGKRVGDIVAQSAPMTQVHPDVRRSGDAATIQAAEALVKALTTPEWGMRKIQAGKMTQRTLSQFNAYQHIPEVKQLIEDIANKRPIDGLTLHYLKRRYVENETISKPDDLNLWFSNALQDKEAILFKNNPGGRYVVHSKKFSLLAVFEPTGQRVSVYDYPVDYKGDQWCLIQQLII